MDILGGFQGRCRGLLRIFKGFHERSWGVPGYSRAFQGPDVMGNLSGCQVLLWISVAFQEFSRSHKGVPGGFRSETRGIPSGFAGIPAVLRAFQGCSMEVVPRGLWGIPKSFKGY